MRRVDASGGRLKPLQAPDCTLCHWQCERENEARGGCHIPPPGNPQFFEDLTKGGDLAPKRMHGFHSSSSGHPQRDRTRYALEGRPMSMISTLGMIKRLRYLRHPQSIDPLPSTIMPPFGEPPQNPGIMSGRCNVLTMGLIASCRLPSFAARLGATV